MISGYLTYSSDSNIDYYGAIGLKKHAPVGEIKRRIAILFKAAHPDNGGSQQRLAQVLEIKEILLNPMNREIYDKTGMTKHDIEKVAAEFTNNMIVLYAQGIDNEADMHQVLYNTYNDSLTGKQNELKDLKKKIANVEKLLDEIEADNILTNMIFTQMSAAKRELDAGKIMLDTAIKSLTGKLVLCRMIKLKTKMKAVQQFRWSNTTSSSTNARW